jgi:hypothetical protein
MVQLPRVSGIGAGTCVHCGNHSGTDCATEDSAIAHVPIAINMESRPKPFARNRIIRSCVPASARGTFLLGVAEVLSAEKERSPMRDSIAARPSCQSLSFTTRPLRG